MRRKCLWTIVLLALLTCAGLAGAQSVEADSAAIRQIWENYAAFVEKGDSAGWLSQWDAEGIQLRADASARTKNELDAQVPAQFKARFDANDTKMAINPVEIVVNGPWAFSRGSYTQDLTARSNGKTIHVDGKFLTVFKRQMDGSWKLYRDCFNSNVPPK
jgi:ketosteroid isomerase-like protein